MGKISFPEVARRSSRKSTRRIEIEDCRRADLSGATILITREKELAQDMAAMVGARGGEPLVFPTIETRFAVPPEGVDAFLRELSLSTWVVLTSAKGAEFLLQILGNRFDTSLSSKNLAVVGHKTAAFLQKSGIEVDLIPETGDGRSLGEALAKDLSKDDVVFYPRAKEVRKELMDVLEERDIAYYAPVLYETVVPRYRRREIKNVLDSPVTYATFTSPSTFGNFIGLAGKESSSSFFKNVKIAVIGKTTASYVVDLGFSVGVIPDDPYVEKLLDAISADISGVS